jgi:hypothetical protein
MPNTTSTTLNPVQYTYHITQTIVYEYKAAKELTDEQVADAFDAWESILVHTEVEEKVGDE